MDELLVRLEKQIRQLITQHARLGQDHEQLYRGQSHLAYEKERLVIKQQEAINQIQTLIAKLKTVES